MGQQQRRIDRIMVQAVAFGLLGLAASALGTYAPYYANLTWEQPRTLSNWSNLTVETRTGTFIGMLNDTYPDVRQFLRVPYAKVMPSLCGSCTVSDMASLLLGI